MQINEIELEQLNHYIKRLENLYEMEFIPSSEVIKETISNIMTQNICDGIKGLRECFVPNEKDIKIKIKEVMEESINKYDKLIHNHNDSQYIIIKEATIINTELNTEKINKLTEPMKNENVMIDNDLISKLVTRVCTHINMKNQNNLGYNMKIRKIEDLVRQEITGKMHLFEIEIDNIYTSVVNRINNEKSLIEYEIEEFGKTTEISDNAKLWK